MRKKWTDEVHQGDPDDQIELYDINAFIRAKNSRQEQIQDIAKTLVPKTRVRKPFGISTEPKQMPLTDSRRLQRHPLSGNERAYSSSGIPMARSLCCRLCGDRLRPQVLAAQWPPSYQSVVAQPTPQEAVNNTLGFASRPKVPEVQRVIMDGDYDRKQIARPTVCETVYPFHLPYDYRNYAYSNPPFVPRFSVMVEPRNKSLLSLATYPNLAATFALVMVMFWTFTLVRILYQP